MSALIAVENRYNTVLAGIYLWPGIFLARPGPELNRDAAYEKMARFYGPKISFPYGQIATREWEMKMRLWQMQRICQMINGFRAWRALLKETRPKSSPNSAAVPLRRAWGRLMKKRRVGRAVIARIKTQYQ